MKLYVVRHAIAEDKGAPADDGARRLTEEGVARMQAAARGMRRFGLKFDALLTSPLERAVETAAIVAAVFDNQPIPELLPALATGITPAQAVKALAPFARHDQLMIVGHEPQLSGLVSLLLTGSSEGLGGVDFKKGGCVVLELPDRFEPGGGRLLWMMTPRQLRKLNS